MSVVELRCPSCSAPLDGVDRQGKRCKYCDALLVPDAAEMDRHEEHHVILETMGPSNRERIARLLVSELEMEPGDADTLLADLPARVGGWRRAEPATELCRKLEESGGTARVGVHIVETPRVPPRSVFLVEVGPSTILVIKTIREHLDMGLSQVKELVDDAPCEIVHSLAGPRAARLHRALLAAGAIARLE